MALIKCTECGQVFENHLKECPNCGCPANECVIAANHNETIEEIAEDDCDYKTVSELFWSCQFHKVFRGKHFDLGQRIYEVGSLWWECIKVWWNCCTTKFAKFDGRASRREYFSFIGLTFFPNPFMILSLYLIVGFIPWIAVNIRRMHDIGKSGWWILVPIANIFLLFKQSDKGANKYG